MDGAAVGLAMRALNRGSLARAGKGYVHTRKPWLSNRLSAVSAGTTIQNVLTAEAAYIGVRLVYGSNNAVGMTGMKALVAPSASLNNDRDPVDGANAAVGWTTVTFNNGGAFLLPPSAAGAAVAAGAVTAGSGSAGTTVESHYASDWMQLQSIARNDGGSLPLLFSRTYFPNAAQAIGMSSPQDAWATDPAVHDGRIIQSSLQTVDGVTTPANFTATSKIGRWGHCLAVQFLSRYRGLSVHAIGDSIVQGAGSQGNVANGFRPWGHIACKDVSQPTRPVTFANWGVSGQTTAEMLKRLASIIDNYAPDVLFVGPFTVNDAAADLTAGRGLFYMRSAIARCLAAGVVPVLFTGIPGSKIGTVETQRLAFNAAVRGAAQDGVPVADFDAALRDPAAQSQLLAAYNSGDNVHPNDAGYAAMAAIARAAVQKIVSANF